MHEWVEAPSYDCLLLKVKSTLAKKNVKRLDKIEAAIRKLRPSDNLPFTEEESARRIKKERSEAPGMDGVTYDVIDDNSVLKFYNMMWNGDRLHTVWKQSAMISIPKPGKAGTYRPRSLTSCLCKLLERIVLSRFMYRIKSKLSSNFYGFISGRSTQHYTSGQRWGKIL